MDMNLSLEDLDFSVRTWKCLRNAGINSLGELVSKSVDDLLEIPNMGYKSIAEITSKLKTFDLDLKGYYPDASKMVHMEAEQSLPSGGYWSEVRNDYFEDNIDPKEGDVLARISIDAWKTEDDNEEGCVIACVMLSKRGDVLVNYIDNVARTDEMAQEAIADAKEHLWDYFEELEEALEDLNDVKNDKIVYFGEGHFVTREALQEMAIAAAEDFISRVNKPNGMRDSKHTFTYDIGSPWDELNMYAEYMVGGDSDRKRWWTVCSLYTKGDDPDMMAVQSIETTTDVNDIATNILELVEELDCQIEINYVHVMREALDMAKPLEEVLCDAKERCAQDKVVEDDYEIEQ